MTNTQHYQPQVWVAGNNSVRSKAMCHHPKTQKINLFEPMIYNFRLIDKFARVVRRIPDQLQVIAVVVLNLLQSLVTACHMGRRQGPYPNYT